jgi:preprotein translocase subunit SecD
LRFIPAWLSFDR